MVVFRSKFDVFVSFVKLVGCFVWCVCVCVLVCSSLIREYYILYIYIYVTCFNVHGVAFQISYVCCFIALCTVAFCFWAYGAGGFLVKTRLVLDIMSFGVILHGRAPAHILAYKW